MNMFKTVNAKNIEEYMSMLAIERRTAMKTLDRLIKNTVPSMKPWFTYNMLGYGQFDYTNYKKEQIKWPVIALASQKNHMSLYICALDTSKGTEAQYIAEKYADKLYASGVKPDVGKSCIRFKKLDDLNLDVLKKVLKEAENRPGLGVDSKK